MYGFEQQVISVLLRPSNGQQFIYTSPMGGMNFLFTVCLELGLVLATPVIVYQLLAFLRPLMRYTTRNFLLNASTVAGALAVAGVLFGYFVGLPSALSFLLNQFTSNQVQPLLTIQAYTQFVALYLLGTALMFQVPLIILLINRIKPLKPQHLLKYERHMFVGSLVTALIINPSPRIADQLFLLVPLFGSYQIAVLMLWYAQRKNTPSRQLLLLREQDAERQAERVNRPLEPLAMANLPTLPAPEPEPVPAPAAVTPVKVIVVESAEPGPTNPVPVKQQEQRRFMEFMPKAQQPLMHLRRQISVTIQ